MWGNRNLGPGRGGENEADVGICGESKPLGEGWDAESPAQKPAALPRWLVLVYLTGETA